MVTIDQLKQIMPLAGFRAGIFLVPINDAMDEFGIDTPARQAAFLAQLAHESMSLRYTRELWNPAQCPWQAKYEGRADLGNTEPGDGAKFKGRGLIQVTGRDNYRKCSQALFADERLLSAPQILEEIPSACRSAAWFWKAHNLNDAADCGAFKAITKTINGGLNGFEDRLAFYELAKAVLA